MTSRRIVSFIVRFRYAEILADRKSTSEIGWSARGVFPAEYAGFSIRDGCAPRLADDDRTIETKSAQARPKVLNPDDSKRQTTVLLAAENGAGILRVLDTVFDGMCSPRRARPAMPLLLRTPGQMSHNRRFEIVRSLN